MKEQKGSGGIVPVLPAVSVTPPAVFPTVSVRPPTASVDEKSFVSTGPIGRGVCGEGEKRERVEEIELQHTSESCHS